MIDSSLNRAHIDRTPSGRGLRLFPAAVIFTTVLVLFLSAAAYVSVKLLREEYQRSSHKLDVELLSRQLEHNINQRLRIILTLARNTHVIDVLKLRSQPDNPDIHLVLNTANEVAHSELVAVYDASGTVVSSSDNKTRSTTGYNYEFRPYFQNAIAGRPSVFPALGVITQTRGVYLSAPVVESGDSAPIGVMVLKIGIQEIESLLRERSAIIALVSPEDVIFSSSQDEWIYNATRPIEDDIRRQLEGTRQFGDMQIQTLDLNLHSEKVSLDGETYIVARAPLPIAGWKIVSCQKKDPHTPLPLLHQYLITTALSVTGGLAILIFILGTNIQRRRATQKKLLRAEEKYYSIFKNAVMGIFQSTIEGKYIEVSPSFADILGYPEPQSLVCEIDDIGRQVYSRPEDRADFIQTLQDKQRINDFEVRFTRKDGTVIWVLVSARIAMDNDGKEPYIEGSCIDITEWVRDKKESALRQQQLIRADQMISLGILTAGIAHEINNPNTFIMSNAELFVDAWKQAAIVLDLYARENGDFLIGGLPYSRFSEKAPVLSHRILDGSRRIQRIVKELRDYSCLQADNIKTSVDINDVILSAEVLLSNMIKKSTHHFELKLSATLPKVHANFQRLEQVIINIVQNACQALPDPDRGITIFTAYDSSEDQVRVECRDEGFGIAEEDLGHVTDPFFTTKRNSGGTGLGLSISSTIIRDLGGAMELCSEPGKGTIVRLRLLPSHDRLKPDLPNFRETDEKERTAETEGMT